MCLNSKYFPGAHLLDAALNIFCLRVSFVLVPVPLLQLLAASWEPLDEAVSRELSNEMAANLELSE